MMELQAFYNFAHVGDILMIRLKESGHVTDIQRRQNLVILLENDEIIGYNLLNASLYINHLKEGKTRIDESFIKELNQYLEKQGMDAVSSNYDDHIVVGHITEMTIHPESLHLHICQVDIGEREIQIVCGASNVKEDACVVVALPSAVLNNGTTIHESKVLGIDSYGMLCSEKELGLSNKAGLLLLNENEYKIGNHFYH